MRKNPWEKRRNLFTSSVPKTERAVQVKWRVLPILWLALKRTCTFLGATVLIFTLIGLWSFSSVIQQMNAPAAAKLPDQMVLYIELDGDLGELPKDVGFADPFASPGTTLKSFVDSIERAKSDPRVKGIYARMNQGGYSQAHIQEMRQAVKSFRANGKFAYMYAPSYDFGLGGYYLASAFDEIWMQPMGNLVIAGINAEIPFVRNVLDRIGIEPQMFQRKEYKGAYETFTRDDMSAASRRATEALIDDLSDVMLADISEDMILPPKQLKGLIDQGLFLADEALAEGLIDRVDYQDVLEAHINMRVTGDPMGYDLTYVDFKHYVAETKRKKKEKGASLFAHADGESTRPAVALIYAVGAIMDTDGENVGVPAGFDDGIAAADEIEEALLSAAYDSDIKAVVLRIDSPGGSPVASETILRAVEKVQQQGKTVTVSMASVAASGGYWIAAYADRIFVMPSTITGSIGVLGGKVSLQEMWAKLGVNWESIQWGKNADMWSVNSPFSPDAKKRINAMLDNIYANFVKRVADGRNMSVDQVDRIAGGRVWSGTAAIEVGIADQVGGLHDALEYAASQAGTNRAEANIIVLPKPLSPVERLVQLLEGQVRAGQIMGIQAKFLQKLQPMLSQYSAVFKPDNTVYAPIIIQ